MKSQSIQRLLVLAVLLFAFVWSIPAQEENPTHIVLIQKIQNDDGTQTVIKKSIYSEEGLEQVIPQFKQDNAGYFSIEFKGEDKGKEPKAFLGVYPSDNPGGDGVLLDGIISNTGAAAAGLRNGDVLIDIEGLPLLTEHNLHEVLALHQPNDRINIVYLRNGERMETVATLGDRFSGAYRNLERDPCQVFIGVMVSGRGADGKGAFVSGIIPKTPAETIGLQAGDVILALDDVETDSHESLLLERNKHQPGDWFTMSVLREGQVMEVDAQFQACPDNLGTEQTAPSAETLAKEDPVIQEEPDPVDPILNTDNTLQLLDFSAFPNPTYGEINISFKANPKPSFVRISDATGRVVFEENLPNFDGYYARQLDLQNATPGLLLLTIQQENRVITQKIMLLAKA